MKKNNGLKVFLAIISALVSFGVGGYSLYLSYLKNYWFILIGIYFLFEGLFILIASGIKDEYKAMRVQGVFQIVGVIIMMDYLLVMSLWNDPEHLINTPLSYYVFSVAAGIKGLTCLIALIGNKKQYNPMLHAYRNNDLITLFYLLLIIELIIVNQYYPGTSVNIFENLFKEKPIWIYVIDVACNATFTILAALLALSTDIRSKTREDLTTIGKIKHTVKWFNDNEVTMFFGLVFTTYLAILALLQVKQSPFYIFVAAYYVGTGVIRLINYAWHKSIQKKCEGNIIRENRLSSFILLFDSGAYLIFSDIICIGAILIMMNKINVGTNIYMFLFMIIPFAIMRLINAGKEIKNGKVNNNTYKLGLGFISLICAFFSILEIIAIATYYMKPTLVVLKYIVVIGWVSITKLFVLIICLVFIIFFIRSLIINRRGKEKKAMK